MVHRQNKSAKYWPNGLRVFLTAISEKGGYFICLWVKNEPLVDPQQSQIGGIETSFFFGLLALPMMCVPNRHTD